MRCVLPYCNVKRTMTALVGCFSWEDNRMQFLGKPCHWFLNRYNSTNHWLGLISTTALLLRKYSLYVCMYEYIYLRERETVVYNSQRQRPYWCRPSLREQYMKTNQDQLIMCSCTHCIVTYTKSSPSKYFSAKYLMFSLESYLSWMQHNSR